MKTIHSDKLKECPFCGGNASSTEKESDKGRPVWAIKCSTGFCISMRRSSKKEVIEDWNTRAKPKTQQIPTCPDCNAQLECFCPDCEDDY